jgi:ParB/Sulfiredoxin domain
VAARPQPVVDDELLSDALRIADDLYVVLVDLELLHEQDLNAQVMKPEHFERLTANVRQRGQLESLPYCSRPPGQARIEILSGHHRVRAARAAGLERIPILLDTAPMTRSQKVAKQIAHNALVGESDRDVLAQMVALLDDVDDLLMTGLDESELPSLASEETVPLGIPAAAFEWRLMSLSFLPHQLERFEELVDALDGQAELVGVVPVELFEPFVRAVQRYGFRQNIRAMGTTIAQLTEIALAELAKEEVAVHD